MEQKRIIELIKSAKSKVLDIDPTNTELTAKFAKAMTELNQAIKELQKSDWISVEDELPQYEEDVLVCNKEEPSDMWFGHRTLRGDVVVDEHGFAKSFEKITHWRKIEKLEV